MKIELHIIGAQKIHLKKMSEWINKRLKIDVMSDLILGLFLAPEIETKLDKKVTA